MKEFISLREFLLLQDPTYKYPRSVFRVYARAEYWASHYDWAKESFEKYGEEGPPIGSLVCTLAPGHGGNAGLSRTFGGIYQSDPRFFQLEREEHGKKQLSLVVRSCWWVEFMVVEDEKSFNWLEKGET